MRLILHNAKIYVGNNSFQQAMLIESGIIKSIGTNEEILLNNADKVIDLQGRTVIPGLNDSHLHLSYIGDAMSICTLTSSRSIEDVIQLSRQFIEENEGLKVLNGRGWNQDYFTSGEKRLLNRNDLDRISTEIPIVLKRVCGHVAVGNSKAIEILGIDENTRVDGGVIELDADGRPNGIFNENATSLLYTIIPDKDDETIESDFLKGANYAISHGITSVQSNDVQGSSFERMFDIIDNIYSNKKTKIRYSHQFNFQNIDDFRNYLESRYNTSVYDERFLSKGALKLFKDGSLGARTALMLNEYLDDPGNLGVAALSDAQLLDLCRLASENGIRVVTHAIGDGAIESVINAYEETMNTNDNPLRHGIVHCQITSKEQLMRIADLNIYVMYQPIFLDYDIKIVESRVGKDLASTSYGFNTLNKLGAHISFGTDSPVEDSNPFPNIYCAVTRMGLDGEPSGGFYPNEKMSVEEVIDAYTIGSAYNEFKENFKGRLQPNYVADLIVLDRDIFTVDEVEIKDIEVEMTMIDGEFVYMK